MQKTPSKAQVESYIREAAVKRGIDPDVAVAVAKSEGLNADPAEAWQSRVTKNGKREPSFGPFQMYTAGGLGNAFQKQTGLSVRDPSTWQAQVDFALNHAATNGWGSWYGARNTGISNWAGIGKNAQPATVNATPANSALSSLANVPTPTAAPRGLLSAPVSPVERSPLGTIDNPTVAGGYITGKPESFMPDVQQTAGILSGVANNPESYTPTENRMIDNARYTAAGPIGVFEDRNIVNDLLGSPTSLYGFGSQFTPGVQAALNPPEQAPALTPARNVSQMAVAFVNPSPAAAPAPSAADFRAGLADWGVATDGTTFSRDALGREVTTTPSGHSTVALDNGLTAAMWGAPAQSQGIQSTIDAPKDFGLHMPSRDKLMGAAKTFGGGAAGGLLGGALLGPLGGLLGAALGRSVAQGKGLQGLLGNGVTRTSFPSAPTMAGQRNSQATTDKIARTFGYSGATGGMDPTERGYAPGAHDSIDRGETVGLF